MYFNFLIILQAKPVEEPKDRHLDMEDESQGAAHIVADGIVYPDPFLAKISPEHRKLQLGKFIIN
jgi:MoaA/NifB/PqqE/SkfB family radical SAM enzyme